MIKRNDKKIIQKRKPKHYQDQFICRFGHLHKALYSACLARVPFHVSSVINSHIRRHIFSHPNLLLLLLRLMFIEHIFFLDLHLSIIFLLFKLQIFSLEKKKILPLNPKSFCHLINIDHFYLTVLSKSMFVQFSCNFVSV